MPVAYAEDFFAVNRWILRCASLWPPENPNGTLQFLYKVYALAMFLFVNAFFTTTEFACLFYTYGNEYDLIKNLSFFLTHFMGAVKVVFFYFRGQKLKTIMAVLESEEFQYESCREKGFEPATLSWEYKKIGVKYTLLFFLLAHATLTSSYLPPTVATLSIIYGGKNDSKLPQMLPYYSWMPFRYDTPGNYLVALGYQAIPMFSYAYSIVGMDTLFMNIMNCIGFNLTVIQGAFSTIRERCVKKIKGPLLTADSLHNSEALAKRVNQEMRKICRHLQTIYKACDDLENVHKYLTLTQVIATVFILCSCLYLVSTTPVSSKQFYAEMVYMLAMGFQLILYCWFGNEVTLKADKLPFYIWQSDWLTADNGLKKSMILTMARAKRPLYLTAGNFAPLTLPTFMAIIKGSYSFFTVLKNTNN